ncbi:hypothetical protein [Trueperella pyogenes]|nr:hypothetical protein [Trueperella pyogenes]
MLVSRHRQERLEILTLAKKVNGSYKNELIHTRTWTDVLEVEIATFE